MPPLHIGCYYWLIDTFDNILFKSNAGWVRGQAGAELGQVLDTFQPDIEIVTLNYRGAET